VLADFAARLAERARSENLTVSEPLAAKLVVYLEVLFHWNRKINLTSLSDPDEAVDRLLLEPIAAAGHLPPTLRLIDFGSGGGSPALPLALALGTTQLVMVESRSRKSAFLREAIREVGVDATVETARFEELAAQPALRSRFDAVSIRAVRHDTGTLRAAGELLKPDGRVALFRGPDGPDSVDVPPESGLLWRRTVPLLKSTHSRLSLLFHVEHS
jgi:16S rRNA (guanine527-N7)-methyltransferase